MCMFINQVYDLNSPLYVYKSCLNSPGKPYRDVDMNDYLYGGKMMNDCCFNVTENTLIMITSYSLYVQIHWRIGMEK